MPGVGINNYLLFKILFKLPNLFTNFKWEKPVMSWLTYIIIPGVLLGQYYNNHAAHYLYSCAALQHHNSQAGLLQKSYTRCHAFQRWQDGSLRDVTTCSAWESSCSLNTAWRMRRLICWEWLKIVLISFTWGLIHIK